MELHYEEANEKNKGELLKLELFPEQSGFIETVEECLDEASRDERWCPVGIYDGKTLVGFSMYGCFKNERQRVWLDRLMIDRSFQHKGYGKEAVKELSELLFKKYDTDTVYLSVYGDNKSAIRLYEKSGFKFNGELDENGEKIMILKK